MNYFFNIDTPTASSTIADTEFKNHMPSINKSMSWQSIFPYIRQATDEFLIPYVGIEMYNEAYQAEAPEEGDANLKYDAKLKMMDIVAWYAVWLAMPHLNRVLSDMGVQQNSNSESTSQPSDIWRYKNARWETMIRADSLLDSLMLYLEDNKENIAAWAQSEIYSQVGHPLFKTTRIWAQYSNILSYRTFLAIKPYIGEAVDMDMAEWMCQDQYDDIISKSIAGTLSTVESGLFELMRKTIANFSLYRAIPHLRITFESNALLMVSSTDGMNMKKDALESAIASLSQRLNENGRSYAAKIKKYLYNNVDSFPIFKENGYNESIQHDVIVSPDGVGGIMIR